VNHIESINIKTQGRRTYEITDRVQRIVVNSGIEQGLCNVFVQHTSASLIVSENADPSVHRDLDAFLARLVKDGDRLFTHMTEGGDDMAAHIRSVLTQTSITFPVTRGRCVLGTWQGIYLWEHRYRPHSRNITVTVMGE